MRRAERYRRSRSRSSAPGSPLDRRRPSVRWRRDPKVDSWQEAGPQGGRCHDELFLVSEAAHGRPERQQRGAAGHNADLEFVDVRGRDDVERQRLLRRRRKRNGLGVRHPLQPHLDPAAHIGPLVRQGHSDRQASADAKVPVEACRDFAAKRRTIARGIGSARRRACSTANRANKAQKAAPRQAAASVTRNVAGDGWPLEHGVRLWRRRSAERRGRRARDPLRSGEPTEGRG